MPLHIQPHRRPATARPAQTHNNPAPVVKLDVHPLLIANASVEIRVAKVPGVQHLAPADGAPDEIGPLLPD